MTGEHVAFIGLDTSKLKISVAVADGERNGEVRFLGDISSEPASIAGMVKKLAKRGAKLHFCYEAGPTGYPLYRQIVELGHECNVGTPSLVPIRELIESNPMLEAAANPILRARIELRNELAKLEKQLCDLAKADSVCRLMMSMPGVGAIVALTVRSAIDDPERFRSSKDVGPWAGLTPRRNQSGERESSARSRWQATLVSERLFIRPPR